MKKEGQFKESSGDGTKLELGRKTIQVYGKGEAKTTVEEEQEKAKDQLYIKFGKEVSKRAQAKADVVMLRRYGDVLSTNKILHTGDTESLNSCG